MALLVFQALGIPKEACVSMLTTIQDMKFFLQTKFGNSSAFAGSTGGIKTQGICQRNGTSPAAWTVTSIAIIQAHKKEGHGIHVQCPITRTTLHLAGTLFMDNTDIKHFNMNSKTVWEAHDALQRSIISWERLLITTAGTLKMAKCFYHMISFLWNANDTI
jgi:hypothetical protein